MLQLKKIIPAPAEYSPFLLCGFYEPTHKNTCGKQGAL
jgi:hypothetical protein